MQCIIQSRLVLDQLAQAQGGGFERARAGNKGQNESVRLGLCAEYLETSMCLEG